VICVDPAPPVTRCRDAPGADLRTTAFLQPSIPVLQARGPVGPAGAACRRLQVMRIVDAGGAEARKARVVKDFDAAEISEQPFGWNLPNWLLRREMVARLAELPDVTFRPGPRCRLLTREAEALVTAVRWHAGRARLVVAPTGAIRAMREAAGDRVKTTRYGQKALAFAVTHPLPHGNVSTEVHRSGGPFTLVPLPDHDGLPCLGGGLDGNRARGRQRLAALPEGRI
jgi:2-octaprenyl-6-methoxyphenol hydroxylase